MQDKKNNLIENCQGAEKTFRCLHEDTRHVLYSYKQCRAHFQGECSTQKQVEAGHTPCTRV